MRYGTQPHFCLLPPQVLERIARNGDDEQRAWALQTLANDLTMRAARSQNTTVRGDGPREGADALAVRMTEPASDRWIWDAEGREDVRGRLVRREGDPSSGDEAVDEAYDYLGDTYAFFQDNFGRDSIDNAGMPLRGVVHFGNRYANAFWDGRRMVFGNGDGRIFSRLTKSLDVCGHELGHGVTETEAGLEYLNQSGALNESMSDVFGSLVKQYKYNQQADAADWLIGADVFSPDISGDALRSMKAPGTAYDDPLLGKDNQPAHMRDYVVTMQDNGGVHINSGIPNHAFYAVATSLGGFAWERAGLIWYEALRHPSVKPRSGFEFFAAVTHSVAERLYGKTSGEVKAVTNGWNRVGITLTG